MVESCFVEVIMEYESGKAIPNNQLLAKMERALGMYLIRTLYLTFFFVVDFFLLLFRAPHKNQGEGEV